GVVIVGVGARKLPTLLLICPGASTTAAIESAATASASGKGRTRCGLVECSALKTRRERMAISRVGPASPFAVKDAGFEAPEPPSGGSACANLAYSFGAMKLMIL